MKTDYKVHFARSELDGPKVGQVIGRLTVIGTAPRLKYRDRWLVRCCCGNSKIILGVKLRARETLSCGCLIKEHAARLNRSHGMSGTKVYSAWLNMRIRCLNKKHYKYPDYGGRGIKICRRWMKFENFLADMGLPPPGHTLERSKNNEGYNPKNCVWATLEQQANNRRSSILFEFENICLSLPQWGRRLDVPFQTLYWRFRKGWPIHRILKEATLRTPEMMAGEA